MMQSSVDAIVIGGGPAGAFSALRLAEAGWDVVLVEKGRRRRNKACGCCLNAKAMAILRDAGLGDELGVLRQAVTRRLVVHVADEAPLTMSIAGGARHEPSLGIVVRRDRFDQWLIDAAAERGACVLQPATAAVESVDAPGAELEVRCGDRSRRFRAPLLIGADGLRSRVAATAGLAPRRRGDAGYGIAFDLESPAAASFGREAIEMFVGERGYLGVVRTGDERLHFGAMVRRQRPIEFIHAMGRRFRKLRRLGLNGVERDALVAFHGAGPMPCRPRAVANEHAALVGDAAGYVEPFTGEGMHWALAGAEALAEAVDGGRPGVWSKAQARRYRALWARRMTGQQRVCAMVAFALRHPILWRTGLRFLRRCGGHMAQGLVDRVVTA